MFGRMVRAFVGTSAPAPSLRSDEARLEDIFSIPSLPLRALFEDIYCREMTQDEYAERTRADYDAAFAGAPLPIALELIRRAPTMIRLARPDTPELRRLNAAFEAAAETARWRCIEQHGADLRIPDDQLPLTLDALGVLVAQGHGDMSRGYGRWLEPVVRSAAGRPDSSDSLIAMFDTIGQGDPLARDQHIAIIERLLPLSGLERSAVALLATMDSAAGDRDAARARISEDAGERLWPAIEAALDNEQAIFSLTLRDAEKNPALKALTGLSPKERGNEFRRLLDILTGFPRYGIENWGMLERQDGCYRMGGVPNECLRGIGNILGALASRKLVLTDPDQDAARFVALLPTYFWLDHRLILKFLLETVRSHPAGSTVAALRAMLDDPRSRHHLARWVTEFEDVLREQPVAAPSPPAPVEPVAAPPPPAPVEPVAAPPPAPVEPVAAPPPPAPVEPLAVPPPAPVESPAALPHPATIEPLATGRVKTPVTGFGRKGLGSFG